jgi:hypothetical protein
MVCDNVGKLLDEDKYHMRNTQVPLHGSKEVCLVGGEQKSACSCLSSPD